jgi:hypothetical protein
LKNLFRCEIIHQTKNAMVAVEKARITDETTNPRNSSLAGIVVVVRR